MMNRKKFIQKGLVGIGSIFTLPSALSSCSDDDATPNSDMKESEGLCQLSPSETAGPFPIKSPADLVRENIISDREGIPVLVQLTVQNEGCEPVSGVFVDVWHCDAIGDYSEYLGSSEKHFLRGRQTTNANGEVSFVSIFPGWYPGRAPHIHLEVLDASENSLLVTQIAFPKETCDEVYANSSYQGEADTSNEKDGIFNDSLNGNMVDSIDGNNTDGYTLKKVIFV